MASASGWHRKRTDTTAERERARQYASREHKQQRAAGQRQVDNGEAHCWRCGAWIPPGARWHVGHDDFDRSVYRGVECVQCNLRAAASKGARTVNGTVKARRSSREW